MTNIYKIIEELASEPSTKKKTEILLKNQSNKLLQEVFFMTLDPFTNYYITATIPVETGEDELTLETLDSVKSNLAGRLVTGHAAFDYLDSLMYSLTEESQIVLKRIINHDLECKVAGGLVNRCWPGLIKEFPVMLSDKFDEKTSKNIKEGKDRIFVQLKADGGRAQVVVSEDRTVSIYSRNGNLLQTHGVFDEIFKNFPGNVFDGELLVIEDGNINNRQTSNGIFNKAVRGTIKLEEAQKFHLVLWDLIPLNDWKNEYSSVQYKDRFIKLISIIDVLEQQNVSLIETKIVSTLEEAQEFYLEMLERKEEGAMLKNDDMPWEAKRSKHCLKLKETKSATLLCIGTTPHSKNPTWVGSIECQTSDGLLSVSIGSGLTEDDRKQPPEYFLNKLIDMEYNALITSKGSNTVSMFLPRYKSIRLDQNTADTLEHLN